MMHKHHPSCSKMYKDVPLCSHLNPLLFQASDNVHLVNVLFQIACQDIQVVFCDCQRTMTEYLLERNHRATHSCPFLRKSMAEAMNTRLFQTPFVAVVPNRMVATTSGQLLSVYRAEKPIFHTPATVL